MRILVTGGAGFIGSHLVARFLGEGYEVRILDDLDALQKPSLTPVICKQFGPVLFLGLGNEAGSNSKSVPSRRR